MTARGTVFTWTVNHHPFDPGVPVPYVIAVVEVDGRRVVGNVVGCEPDEVHIGMAVEAELPAPDGQAPQFRPATP